MIPFASDCARVLTVFLCTLSAHGWEPEYAYGNTLATAAAAALWIMLCHGLSYAQEKLYWRACPAGAHAAQATFMGLLVVAGCYTGSPAAYVPYLYLFTADTRLGTAAVQSSAASAAARACYAAAVLAGVIMARLVPRDDAAHVAVRIAASVILFAAWFDAPARTHLHATMATGPVRDTGAAVVAFGTPVLCVAMMGEVLRASDERMCIAVSFGALVGLAVPVLSHRLARITEVALSVSLGILCFFTGSAAAMDALYTMVAVAAPILLALAMHRTAEPTTSPPSTQTRKARHALTEALALALCGAVVVVAPVYARASRAGPELQTALVLAALS